MTYRTIRQRLLLGAGSTVIMSLLLAAAANSQASAIQYDPSQRSASDSRNASASDHPTASHVHFWEELMLEPQDAWSKLRDSFQWREQSLSAKAQARVDEWIDHYRSSPENIAEITGRASPWLAWITQQISDRNLPGELALIPFVESSFDPNARSHRGAAGLWQFMPGTGDALGLVRNGHYDGRLDVVTSTNAALDYLEMQADQWYEGDLQLSLAAYNAGAGTVNKAKQRAENQGLQGSYWDLNLPQETMQYLPKLLAIAKIIDDPERYNVSLPDIHTEPAFAKVKLEHSVTLSEASKLLRIDKSALAELNPGLLNGALNPSSSQTLLVPEDVDHDVLAELSNGANERQAIASANTPDTYRVESGDSLSVIASRYNLSAQELMRLNEIERPEALQAGQLLTLSGR
ncbi:transglycosylase SLT domain-containing protein [Halomonas janggokensis]|jgi:membrane-bound lytic murein transglycosylase D|uniref:Transglycosylase SLT domain-containing protein n=1 Tax=Vreelandella janggokensis TaxID=370767 RepID=A0ABT4IRN5_9GAMM|nr:MULTISPECIES: transglycosylase SLT domain-containing protein [Halomonas]MCW4153469.1 transglycosylase SLT domain-containing protein [Halomonas sp. 18H]MCZ0926324.1 transglycosylase SLT domain-containing protein [Halomonas janggokensis]MCZ0928862.1 transglycosylase SLT domain-containing protein [Halomonas janggokensis]QPL47836.1 transglycosylase SLT domain-containing protein [Halomonas sp. A40-4]